ncbi:MAG: Rieske (2Fe-2S) protein [Ardenticatenaceae bacterium]|nr:Rieske (2Fe-2S) protein [Ardenticatenaceae bacterium]
MNATPSNIKFSPISRRSFLDLTGKSLLLLSGMLGLGGLFRYLGFQTEGSAPNTFDLGSAENYPPGSRTFISEAQAYILHRDDGFVALSAICPHLGCSVNQATGGFDCPCHGSRFNANGEWQQGPAKHALRNLTVKESADGQLTLLT